jgi:ABC-type sugar transport system permease subunit
MQGVYQTFTMASPAAQRFWRGYSAISIVVFSIVATLTLIQFRFTNMWEEMSRNA